MSGWPADTSSAEFSGSMKMPPRFRLLYRDRIGPRAAFYYLLRSSGILVRFCKRSLWVHGESPVQFDAARRLIQQAMRDRPHVRLVLTSASPATVEFLRGSFPNDMACPVPLNLGPGIRRFLSRLKPGTLILLDGGRSLGRRTLNAAVSRGIPVAAVNVRDPAGIARHLLDAARSHSARVLLCLQDHACAAALHEAGVSAECVSVTGSLDLEPGRPSQQANRATLCDLLGVAEGTPIVAAAAIPEVEETLVMGAFAKVREIWPEARLVFEPLFRARTHAILEQIRQRGWIAYRRRGRPVTPPVDFWDVLVQEIPGEVPAIMPLAFATVVGGSFLAGKVDTALAAAAVTAGSHVVVAERENLGEALAELLNAEPPPPPGAQHRHATSRTLDALRDHLPVSPTLPRDRQDWRVPSLRDLGGRSRLWKTAARPLMTRRIDSWETLRERLGDPKSVLCLGNGPSSEDHRLESLAHDCLMRVNWRWSNSPLPHPARRRIRGRRRHRPQNPALHFRNVEHDG